MFLSSGEDRLPRVRAHRIHPSQFHQPIIRESILKRQTNTAGYSTPTSASSASGNSWPSDPSPPSNGSIRAHPRLIAPGYKWSALTSGLIANNPYFAQWNATIVANASATLNFPPVAYTPDGGLDGSGVLDVAREMKLRVKNWAYAYRVTNDTRYADRVWLELRVSFARQLRWIPVLMGRLLRATTQMYPSALMTVLAGTLLISSMSPNSAMSLLSATIGCMTDGRTRSETSLCGR